MSVLRKLTIRHLLHNPRRTGITIVGIVLSVAMVGAVSGMVVSFQDMLYRDSIAREGDWHVRYRDIDEELGAAVLKEPVFSGGEWTDTEDGPALSLRFARLRRAVFDESEAVCHKYGIDRDQVRYHNNLLVAKGIVPGGYYEALYTFAAILLALIAVGSVLVISNAFAISSDQRSQQFGLLKSAGATKTQIRGMVLFEGVVLVAVSIPLGILVGFLAQWVALTIANRVFDSMAAIQFLAAFRVVPSPLSLGVTVVAAVFTVMLAAWFPARRAARVSAVEAIRQTRSVRLSRRQVRVSPLTRRLFGFEGVLGAKSMGRSRGKHRATTLALVVSIVLFIGVSSFGDILTKATSMIYEDTGSNVVMTMNGADAIQHDQLYNHMAQWDGARLYPSRDIGGEADIPDSALTPEYRQLFSGYGLSLRLFSVGQADYEALCKSLRIRPDTGGGAIDGILVNSTGTWIEKGRRMSFRPYAISAGDRFPVTVGEEPLSLHIVGVTEEITPAIFPRFTAYNLNVIVADDTIAGLWPEDQEDFFWVSAMANDSAAFTQRAREFLEDELPDHTWSAVDYESLAANNRNIGTLVMVFVYGFIAMLTLIGVTSVIATISTNIALRAREFAMLRSVGMTQDAIAKMLRYESLLYGIRALLLGIPLGLVTCLLLYRAMTSVMDFPFLWPVRSIAISVVAVLLITFSIMAFSLRKQRSLNIVDVLRDGGI